MLQKTSNGFQTSFIIIHHLLLLFCEKTF